MESDAAFISRWKTSSLRISSASVAWMARRIESFLARRSHANSASSDSRMLRADSSSRARTAARTSRATAAVRISLETVEWADEDEAMSDENGQVRADKCDQMRRHTEKSAMIE